MRTRNLLCALVLVSGCGPVETTGDGGVPDTAVPTADAADAGADAGRLACPTAGAHHALTLDVEGESRFYYLYVPASVDCDVPAALWVDFHGTASDVPEEAYGLDAQVALADREGFVLVRPRSRFSSEGGGVVYRWDQNPGDLDRNTRFTELLVEELSRTFTVDPARLYVSGFSSGSNMTARLLGETSLRFRGFGPIAGGIFGTYPLRDWAGEPFRVYAGTGYRDYLHFAQDALLAALERGGVSGERVFVREADTGHELYSVQFEEMWAFFEDGRRPPAGTLGSAWRAETTGTTSALLDVERSAAGELLAVGSGGVIVARAADGTWSPAMASATGPVWTDACTTGDGHVLVVGEGRLATRAPGGAFAVRADRLPELGDPMFGYAYVNAVACGAGMEAVLGGYWSGLATTDGGATFTDLAIDFGGYTGQVAAMAVAGETTWASGYYGVARGGARLDAVDGLQQGWMLDVTVTASGAVLIVDDHGEIYRSPDGTSFSRVVEGDGRMLSALASLGDEVMAVGAGGRVLWSVDDGATFEPVDTGLDAFLGGVVFLGPGEAIAVGEDGAALHFGGAS